MKVSVLFPIAKKHFRGGFGERDKSVVKNFESVRSLRLITLFLIRQSMNSMIFEVGLVELYSTLSNSAHCTLNLVALWMPPTSLNDLIFFQIAPGIAVDADDRGLC